MYIVWQLQLHSNLILTSTELQLFHIATLVELTLLMTSLMRSRLQRFLMSSLEVTVKHALQICYEFWSTLRICLQAFCMLYLSSSYPLSSSRQDSQRLARTANMHSQAMALELLVIVACTNIAVKTSVTSCAICEFATIHQTFTSTILYTICR